jgi:tetratricopeptide (TPR) repeat protein
VAGSFLRYLADTYGTEKLRALYAHADFDAAYGRPLDALATEWEKHLDALPLDEATVSRAFQRFRTGSLFARACAREVVRLEDAADDALRSDPQEAFTLYQRAASLQPEEPSFLMGQARALEALERPEDADKVLAEVAEKVKDKASMAAEVAMARADMALKLDQPTRARTYLESVLSLASSPEVMRTAYVKLAALDSPSRRTPIVAYFRSTREELRMVLLARALEADPKDPYLHYLLARRLHGAGAPALAQEHFGRALQGELPQAIRREALRLLVESNYLAGDCGAVRHEVGALPDYGPAFKALATEWVARCEFEDATYRGPLVPRQAFR